MSFYQCNKKINVSVVQKTQAQYTALTTAEKMNGSIYKITDNGKMYCLDREYRPIKELTQAEYDALTPAQKADGTIYMISDANKPDYIVFFLDISNSSTVLDFTATNGIFFSGNFNATRYMAVENDVKRTITKNEFIAFEKQGVKSFIILKCKAKDNDGYTYTDSFIWEFLPNYVSGDLPNYNSSSYRKALAFGGNSSLGFGAGYLSFELINDNATTANFTYYKV